MNQKNASRFLPPAARNQRAGMDSSELAGLCTPSDWCGRFKVLSVPPRMSYNRTVFGGGGWGGGRKAQGIGQRDELFHVAAVSTKVKVDER